MKKILIRLEADDIERLEQYRLALAEKMGVRVSTTDAIRIAIRVASKKRGEKNGNAI